MREKLALGAARADVLASRMASAGMGFLLWPILYGVALSAGTWSLAHEKLAAAMASNKLPKEERAHAIVWLASTIAAVALVYLLVIVGRRFVDQLRKPPGERRFRFVETAAALNRRLSFLLAVPFVVKIARANIEKDSPKLTLFLIAVASAIGAFSVYAWLRPARPLPDPDEPRSLWRAAIETLGPWAGPLAALSLWAAYAAFFSNLSVTNHHALITRTIDLGYYDNIFFQSIHGEPLGCSFIKAGNHSSAHFDPILVLLAPLYLLYPRAEFLLVLQSVWLGAGAIPVYLLGKRLLESRKAGVVLALMYCAYPALHGANMYEFHSLTLVTPPILFLLYFLETGATIRYFLTLAVALLIREDVPLVACFIGLYGLLAGGKRVRIGRYTIILSIAYFAIVKAFFMQSSGILNAGEDAYSFEYYYDAMIPDRNGIGGLVSSILTNPLFALELALEEQKVVFLLLIFLPLFFLPLFARAGRVMLVYGLLFCLLASRGPVFTIHFQYTSVLFPIAFALTPIAIAQIRDGRLPSIFGLDGRRLGHALLGAAFFATMLTSFKFGGIVDNATFRGGFSRVARTLSEQQEKTYAWIEKESQAIPKGASVGTTNRAGPHVSNRMRAYFYPQRKDVDYLFIDESELKAPQLEAHKKAIAKGDFVEVSRYGRFAVLKRRGL